MAVMDIINKNEYRADIDGLRAVAICSVLLFHAFPRVVPGGFVGVDIFFVISGFLISKIIISEILANEFSFRNFYSRRIRRIFPALALTLTTVLGFGWFVLFPAEFQQLGRHVFAGAAFFSNFQLWSETGYFDKAAELKPLLHLWSLGIEEQFYLLLPLLLISTKRYLRHLLLILGVLWILSMLLGVKLTTSNNTAAFYSPLSRAWELIAGCLLAMLSTLHALRLEKFRALPGMKNMASLCGIVLIICSLAVIDKAKQFPGLWAIPPVLGSTLLIAAGPTATANRWLENRVFVQVGLISYPLYLWHWPIISYLNIVERDAPSNLQRCAGIAAALVLAYLTYHLIEKPVRRSQATGRNALAYLSAVAIIGAIGFLASKGLIKTHLESNTELLPIFSAINDNDLPQRKNILQGNQAGLAVFIGDSFLEHYYSRIKSIVPSSSHSLSVVYMGSGGCPPLPNISRISDPGGCAKILAEAFERANRDDVKSVVIGSAWHYFYPITARNIVDDPTVFSYAAMVYLGDDPSRTGISPGTPSFTKAFKGLRDQIEHLISSGKRVYLVLPTPISDDLDPLRTVNRLTGEVNWQAGIYKSSYLSAFAPVTDQLRNIAKSTGATLLDPTTSLCHDDFCAAFHLKTPIYKDVGHIRPFFSAEYIKTFDDAISDVHQQTSLVKQTP